MRRLINSTLMAVGLLDELRLWVHPFFLGKGGPQDLLYRHCPPTMFRTGPVITLSNGIVILTFHARQRSAHLHPKQ